MIQFKKNNSGIAFAVTLITVLLISLCLKAFIWPLNKTHGPIRAPPRNNLRISTLLMHVSVVAKTHNKTSRQAWVKLISQSISCNKAYLCGWTAIKPFYGRTFEWVKFNQRCRGHLFHTSSWNEEIAIERERETVEWERKRHLSWACRLLLMIIVISFRSL